MVYFTIYAPHDGFSPLRVPFCSFYGKFGSVLANYDYFCAIYDYVYDFSGVFITILYLLDTEKH